MSMEARRRSRPFGIFEGTRRSFEQGKALYGSGTIRLTEWLNDLGVPDAFGADVFGGWRLNSDREYLDLENLPNPLRAPGQFDDEVAFHEHTWEAGLRFFVHDEHTLYGKFSKGYKPGFQQLDVNTQTPSPVDPELIRGWEIGWKAQWMDGRLTTSLAIFDYDYTDLQVPQILPLGVFTTNAGGAESRGVELESVLALTPDWILHTNLGYLDATLTEACIDDPAQFFTTPEPGCAQMGRRIWQTTIWRTRRPGSSRCSRSTPWISANGEP